MKKTIFITLLLLAGLLNTINCMAQNGSDARKKVSRVRVASPLAHCKWGFGICIDIGSYGNRTATIGIERINNREQLCIYKERLSPELLRELEEADVFPIDNDLTLEEEISTQLGFTGTLTLRKGKHQITNAEDKFTVAIPIIHQ